MRSAREDRVPADHRVGVTGLAGAVGSAAAVGAWIGWIAVSPRLGLPELAPAEMLGAIVAPEDPESWIGWALLTGGLTALAGAYHLMNAWRPSRPSVSSGVVYGLLLWLVVGAVVMPMMGALSSDAVVAVDPMGPVSRTMAPPQAQATFMMLHLGPGAPIAASLAWALFGGVLGATRADR